MMQQSHFWVDTQMNWMQGFKQTFVHKCSQQHIHNSPKVVEATQVSVGRWLDEQMWSIHTVKYYSGFKGRTFWHMLQYRWTLKTLYWEKQISHKRTNTGWLHQIHKDSRIVVVKADKKRKNRELLFNRY